VPILSYGIESIKATKKMYSTLEVAYSAAFSRIFKTYDKNIIKQCHFCCCVLPFSDVIDLRKLHFLHGLNNTDNFTLMYLFATQGQLELTQLIHKHGFSPDTSYKWKATLFDNLSLTV
jgi:hypothetical protein